MILRGGKKNNNNKLEHFQYSATAANVDIGEGAWVCDVDPVQRKITCEREGMTTLLMLLKLCWHLYPCNILYNADSSGTFQAFAISWSSLVKEISHFRGVCLSCPDFHMNACIV